MSAMPILNQSLFDATHAAARALASEIPLKTVAAGTIVWRSVAAAHRGMGATADAARIIWNGAVADYRWSGLRPGGPGIGALYVSMHLDAVSSELFHYAERDPALPEHHPAGRVLAQDALVGRRLFRFELTRLAAVADLSLASGRARTFLDLLGGRADVRKALVASGYASAVAAYKAPADYSFSRALALAIAEQLHLVGGLEVTTAREDWPTLGETANNLVLFGTDGLPLPLLRPLSMTSFDRAPTGRLEQTVTRFA
jgi:hypothetical protein